MNAHEKRRLPRRGVLLLVVLSMLTLFLLLGTAYLVVSSRSRDSAKAFNRLVMRSESNRVPAETYLDAAFLQVLRGGGVAPKRIPPPLGIAPPPATFESLLEDKYGQGTTLTGTAQLSGTIAIRFLGTGPSPVLELPSVTLSAPAGAVAGGTPPVAAELPGRVLTLCPNGGEPTSHRILQATGNGTQFRLLIDAASRATPTQLPTTAVPVLVNGREFDGQGATNEAWDAFDIANPFLAHIEPHPTIVSSGTVRRMSYVLGSGSDTDPQAFDNDNDGRKDSMFLDFGFPGIPTASGTVDLHAAVLVVDLDSRFNVNAHGSLTSRLYPTTTSTHSGWPTASAIAPLGSGYGPAEINAAWMYPTGTAGYPATRIQTQPPEDPARTVLTGLTGTVANGRRPSGSRFTLGTTTPLIQAVQGRYGEAAGWSPVLSSSGSSTPAAAGDALPGQAATDDVLSQVNDQRTRPQRGANSTAWSVTPTSVVGIPVGWWTGTSPFDWRNYRTSYNSPPDLHGRMKTFMAAGPSAGGIVPTLVFAKPEWGLTETRDDPYEIVLGAGASLNGWMGDPSTTGFMPVYDNPFSVSELEPVLRPYDLDTFRLPQRLAAILGSVGEESRLRVTTASWDTTAITGSAAVNLATWLKSGTPFVSGTSAVTGRLGGEAARGERFDLNRPLTSQKPPEYDPADAYYVQRQAYFKDLYTLLCAILHPTANPTAAQAQEYAQWAANVVEFRDADSTITPFEYDDNLLNGWDVDGDARTPDGPPVVWGAERPELLIMETSAWEDTTTGELFIVLHRPWNSDAVMRSGTQTVSVPGEPIDASLDVAGVPLNELDLGRKAGNAAGNDSTAYPIWRLRIEDDAGNQSLVRLDVTGSSAGDFSSTNIATTGLTPRMPVDSWLAIVGKNTIGTTITAPNPVTIDRGGAFRVPGPLPTQAGGPRNAMVYLERLTDPSSTSPEVSDGTVWSLPPGSGVTPHYAVVDQAPIEVVNRTPQPPPAVQPPPPPSKISRDVANPAGGLWKCRPRGAPGQAAQTISLGSSSFSNARAKWFPWPNRPFTSPAELFLVPGGSALDMLRAYQPPSDTVSDLLVLHQRAAKPLLLLDAVHVPTRFAGIHRTVTADPGNALRNAGIFAETTPVNQLSSFREPGRVNLNTVTADDVWNAVVAGPLATIIPTGTTTADPLRSRATPSGTAAPAPTAQPANFTTAPATSMADILALQGTIGSGTATAAFTPDTNPALAASAAMNPALLLYTANRLANTATIRSHVFAVWITLRESIQDDPDSVRYHRAFYIVDRSIPVAHEPGKDNNVWDAVLLRRIIE